VRLSMIRFGKGRSPHRARDVRASEVVFRIAVRCVLWGAYAEAQGRGAAREAQSCGMRREEPVARRRGSRHALESSRWLAALRLGHADAPSAGEQDQGDEDRGCGDARGGHRPLPLRLDAGYHGAVRLWFAATCVIRFDGRFAATTRVLD
jgi:hypothetical protein